MARGSWKDVAELAGIAAIVASLIFVGLEMRQSREIAIADIYQQRTAILLDVYSLNHSVELTNDLANRFLAGEELTGWDLSTLLNASNSMLAYWENNHFQYQLGLLTEEQWTASRNSMRRRIRNPYFLEWWEKNKDQWRESFVQAVDEVVEEERAKQSLDP